MKRSATNSRGATLVLCMLTLVSATILILGIIGTTRMMMRESVFQERETQAQTIAEAGLEDALLQLRLDSAWRTGFTNKAFAGGSYTVTLTSGTPPSITTVGSSQAIAFFGAAQATVISQALIQISTSNACTTYSGGNTTVNGLMDAYDSEISTTPTSFSSNGHLCSNNKFTPATGAVRVRMNVDYFTNPIPPAGTVDGTVTKSTFTRTLPVFDGAPFVSSNNNSSLSPTYFTAGTKALSVPYGSTMTISAGTYYLNSITVNGSIMVNTSTGPVVIYINNNLTLTTTSGSKTGNINNQSKIPSKLALYPQGSRTFTLSSAFPLYAVIAGGSTSMTLTAPQVLYGNLIGNVLTINTGALMHYDVQTSGSNAIPSHVTWQMGTWSSN